MKPFTYESMTLYTKTVAALKQEKKERLSKAYEARHKHDRIQLLSVLLCFALAAPAAIGA